MSEFIDAKVFVRHLADDHPTHSPAASRYLRAIEDGERAAWTAATAVAEVVYVLSSKQLYGHERREIARGLEPLLMLPGIAIDHKRVLSRAFALYLQLNIDFLDCYHAALAEERGQPKVVSFDKDFDRISGIERVEPGSD